MCDLKVIQDHEPTTSSLCALAEVDVFPIEEILRVESATSNPESLTDSQTRSGEPSKRGVHRYDTRGPDISRCEIKFTTGKPHSTMSVEDSRTDEIHRMQFSVASKCPDRIFGDSHVWIEK